MVSKGGNIGLSSQLLMVSYQHKMLEAFEHRRHYGSFESLGRLLNQQNSWFKSCQESAVLGEASGGTTNHSDVIFANEVEVKLPLGNVRNLVAR